ncbi:glycoside hydrolase family 35 protein [Rhizoctonia solani]|uniref:Beta-galactosidase n=1 Tax=Rhizoctonia solani TaxID=456999 RepID=A0A8H8P2Q1_9AGAM|nr:glycoside hydrolase family 35 protein [Rhizoctonia solani]QRW22851.1 glycoside hydrolase family 35 protein [Rhizoctonia solani]
MIPEKDAWGVILLSNIDISGELVQEMACSTTISRRPYSHSPKHVQWDGKSLFIKGQRIFLWSGEFHTFRLPAPELWGDILEKTKAAGFNAISVYVHWGLVNPAPGELDFDGPGPYINAEVSGGGIPHWATSEISGHLRTNSTDYTRAWEPYVDAIADILVKGNWQIGDKTGGPVIAVQLENEYLATHSPGHKYKTPYMAALAKRFVDKGVVVPLTYNDAYMGGNYATGEIDQCEEGSKEGGEGGSHGRGAAAWSYTDVLTAPIPTLGTRLLRLITISYENQSSRASVYTWYEFQGGSFDAWGGGVNMVGQAQYGLYYGRDWTKLMLKYALIQGYEACRQLTGPEFSQVFNLGLWANNAKMVNLYMLYGGTTWGYMTFPEFTHREYDYGAAITETRRLTSKYAELKRQGLFLRSVPEFYATDVIGNSTDSDDHPTVVIDNQKSLELYYAIRILVLNFISFDTWTRHLETPPISDSLCLRLYILQCYAIYPTHHSFDHTIWAASKVLLRNVLYGSSRLAWSTASILYAVKWEAEMFFLARTFSAKSCHADISAHFHLSTCLVWLSGALGRDPSSFRGSETAGNFWAPVLAPQESDSFSEWTYANFYQFGTNSSVLVGGPYLVPLRGDLEKESMLTVIAELGAVRRVFWNGFPVDTMLQDSSTGTSGVLRFQIAPRFRTNDITVPELANWRYQDSLPEVKDGFDDSKWTVANRTSTNIPGARNLAIRCYTDVIMDCTCEGAVVWRGHFKGDSGVTGVRLVINGGFAFAASVWLNGKFLATTYGNSSNHHNNVHTRNGPGVPLPRRLDIQGEDNVITVVQDNMGLEMTVDWTADSSKSPRGIRGYELIGGAFTEWKVQGKKGGYTGFKDKLRGILNEGGLYGERQGWHLPDFDDSEWAKVDLSNGLPNSQAGVGWFRTTFSLDIPQAYDVPISFEFKNEPAPYRALLFVNGWLMGRYIANLGPQFKFPVPEGILNHHGENTVALAIWSMENTQLSPNLKLTIEGVFDSGYEFDSPL